MTVTIPDERLGHISIRERDAIVDVSIGLYKRKEVSLGRAAEIAGVSSPEFLGELAKLSVLSPNDLHEAVLKYLNTQNLTLVVLEPEGR